MKFLVDNSLSPIIARKLTEHGHDARHLHDYQRPDAADDEVFNLARREGRILISSDADFGAMLALKEWQGPSLILLRGEPRRPEAQVELLLLNFTRIQADLEKGCIVVFQAERIRVRLFRSA